MVTWQMHIIGTVIGTKESSSRGGFRGVVRPHSQPLNLGRSGKPKFHKKKAKRRSRKSKTKVNFCVFLYTVCLKCQKSGRKLVMLCMESKKR